MDANVNAINWFEIPALDINRAKKFYESIFGFSMHLEDMMGMKMAGFPGDPKSGKVSGALVQSEMHKPTANGLVIYLNGNPDLADVLAKVEGAGGKIKMPKTLIAEDVGFMAFFTDSEGNTIGLHSNK